MIGSPAAPRFAPVTAIVRSALAHRVPNLAAEAAFFVALAMFPMLLTVIAVLRTAAPLLGANADLAVAEGTTQVLRIVLGSRNSDAADAAGRLLAESDTGVLTVGTVSALLLMIRTLRSVFYALGVVAGRRPRTWLAALLLAVVLVAGGASAIAVAVANPLDVLGLPRIVWNLLRWPAMALALFGWTWVLLRTGMGMRGRVARRPLLLGAGVTTVGWFAASGLLPLYVALARRFTPALSALGGGVVLLLWLYLLMLALYVGAEVGWSARAGPSTTSPGSGRDGARPPSVAP